MLPCTPIFICCFPTFNIKVRISIKGGKKQKQSFQSRKEEKTNVLNSNDFINGLNRYNDLKSFEDEVDDKLKNMEL